MRARRLNCYAKRRSGIDDATTSNDFLQNPSAGVSPHARPNLSVPGSPYNGSITNIATADCAKKPIAADAEESGTTCNVSGA